MDHTIGNRIIEFKAYHVPPDDEAQQEAFYRDLLFGNLQSTESWRRECEASLRRSQARRAEPRPSHVLDLFFRCLMIFIIVGLAVGLLLFFKWVSEG